MSEAGQRRKVSRRGFLAGAAGIVAGFGFPYVVPSSVLGRGGVVVPSERIVMGCVGMGIQGPGDMRAFLGNNDVQVVAVCDVSEKQRAKGKGIVDDHYGNGDCAVYGDFREMFAREDIDALMLAAPDHWHAVMGIEAAGRGKHMYYEKPMGLSLEWSRALAEAVKGSGVVFQFGTQQRSERNFQFACELVRNEKIGKLRRIIVAAPPSIEFPLQQLGEVPEGFDYDMWLGPAPYSAYSYERVRPYVSRPGEPWFLNYSLWYHISDYCLGFIANWGIHHLDIAAWGHGSGSDPVKIRGEGTFPADGEADCATGWHVEMEYADGVELTYIDSDRSSRFSKHLPEHGRGIEFIGEDGWVSVARDNFIDAGPKGLLGQVTEPGQVYLGGSVDHHRNFLDAVRDGRATIAPVDQGQQADTLCHLSDIAIRLGRELRWDGQRRKFVGDEEASRMLNRSMRSPWRL